jgi:hypothetical protein
VSDLKSYITLQARLYAFLDQQDESTLQAIASGAAQLAVIGASSAPILPATNPATALPAPEDLSNLKKQELLDLARSLKLRNYSGLTKPKLVELLTNDGRSPAEAPAQPPPADTGSKPPAEPPRPDVDVAAVASHLRETETEDEGAEYLRTQGLDRESLLAVAAELQLTRVSRLNQTELEKRVLKQAIGARRKFAGLRKW